MFRSSSSAINNRKWTPLSHTCVYQILLRGQPGAVNLAKGTMLIFQNDSRLHPTKQPVFDPLWPVNKAFPRVLAQQIQNFSINFL